MTNLAVLSAGLNCSLTIRCASKVKITEWAENSFNLKERHRHDLRQTQGNWRLKLTQYLAFVNLAAPHKYLMSRQVISCCLVERKARKKVSQRNLALMESRKVTQVQTVYQIHRLCLQNQSRKVEIIKKTLTQMDGCRKSVHSGRETCQQKVQKYIIIKQSCQRDVCAVCSYPILRLSNDRLTSRNVASLKSSYRLSSVCLYKPKVNRCMITWKHVDICSRLRLS